MWSGIFWSVDCVVLFVSMVHIKHSAAEWLNFTLFRHGNPFQIWWGRSLNELFTRLSFQGEFSRNEENHEKAKVISRCASIFCLLVAVWLNEIQIIYDYIIRHSPHGSWHATRTFDATHGDRLRHIREVFCDHRHLATAILTRKLGIARRSVDSQNIEINNRRGWSKVVFRCCKHGSA